MLSTLAAASRVEPVDNGPPYDIAKLGEDKFRITMAVAGFLEDGLAVSQERTILEVAGEKGAEDGREYLQRGIAGRAFRRRFELADHVKVVGTSLVNGLLTVDLRREVPRPMGNTDFATGCAAGATAERDQESDGQASSGNGPMTKVSTNTVDPDELAGLATCYLDCADADLLRAFELALADLVVAERHISWSFVRGRIDPVSVPEIFVQHHKVPEPG